MKETFQDVLTSVENKLADGDIDGALVVIHDGVCSQILNLTTFKCAIHKVVKHFSCSDRVKCFSVDGQ
jgi:hypothetical protein